MLVCRAGPGGWPGETDPIWYRHPGLRLRYIPENISRLDLYRIQIPDERCIYGNSTNNNNTVMSHMW